MKSPSSDHDAQETCTISAKGESDYFLSTEHKRMEELDQEDAKQDTSSINDMLRKY